MNAVEFSIAENTAVVLTGPEKTVTIDGRTLYYREGDWLEKDEDGEYYADWSLTWFYEDRKHPEDYFYFEQDPPKTAIHNLRRKLDDK